MPNYPASTGRDGDTELDPHNPIGATRIFARDSVRAFQGFVQGIEQGIDSSVRQVQRSARDSGRFIRGEQLIPPINLDARDAGVFPPLVKDMGDSLKRIPLPMAPIVPAKLSLPMAPIVPRASKKSTSLIVSRCLQAGGGGGCYEPSYFSVVGSGKNGGNSALAECLKYGGGKACYGRR